MKIFQKVSGTNWNRQNIKYWLVCILRRNGRCRLLFAIEDNFLVTPHLFIDLKASQTSQFVSPPLFLRYIHPFTKTRAGTRGNGRQEGLHGRRKRNISGIDLPSTCTASGHGIRRSTAQDHRRSAYLVHPLSPTAVPLSVRFLIQGG